MKGDSSHNHLLITSVIDKNNNYQTSVAQETQFAAVKR